MYGEVFEDNYVKVEAGINNCKVKSFGLNPNGGAGGNALDVIDLVLGVGGLDIKARFFELTKGYPREVKNPLTGVKEMQTDEAALKDALKNQQLMLRSILSSFGVETATFVEKMKTVKSFKDFAQLFTDLTPSDIGDKDFECILQYDNKGYLKLPTKLYITGKVLRMKDSEQPALQISDKVKLVKLGSETEDEAVATSEVKW